MKRIEVNSYVYPERVGDVECKEKTMTQQSFANEVDVNQIVARALKTGILGDPLSIQRRQEIFGDFSEIGSYQDALNRVINAQKAFDELPADIRSRFNNEPGLLMEFLSNPGNRDEAIKLGLIVSDKDKEKLEKKSKPAEEPKA